MFNTSSATTTITPYNEGVPGTTELLITVAESKSLHTDKYYDAAATKGELQHRATQ